MKSQIVRAQIIFSNGDLNFFFGEAAESQLRNSLNISNIILYFSRNFFQGLALDLAKENIPVSVICPGFVRTPLTDKNDFPMPGRIEPESAAARIVAGMRQCKTEISFPKRFTWPFRLISILPAGIRFSLLKRIV